MAGGTLQQKCPRRECRKERLLISCVFLFWGGCHFEIAGAYLLTPPRKTISRSLSQPFITSRAGDYESSLGAVLWTAKSPASSLPWCRRRGWQWRLRDFRRRETLCTTCATATSTRAASIAHNCSVDCDGYGAWGRIASRARTQAGCRGNEAGGRTAASHSRRAC